MTRLRQVAMAGLAALAIGGAASSASATKPERFENRLNGATIGLPLGAAPPPGLYTGLETAYLGMLLRWRHLGPRHRKLRPHAVLPAVAQAVPLLWVPGWNFWGATYSASVVQAFYVSSACTATTNAAVAAVLRSALAGSSTPTPSSNRLPYRGNSAAAGSCRPTSPSRHRTARIRPVRRTPITGHLNRLSRSLTWVVAGSRP